MIKLKTPNFEVCNNRKIKYIIIHYTDMKTLSSAIKRLQSKVAKVSCHYIISKKAPFISLLMRKILPGMLEFQNGEKILI